MAQTYAMTDVQGFDQVAEDIKEAESHDNYEDRIEAWSFILGDHITWGNNKISNNTAIFNMNSASDCPNRETKDEPGDVGSCQVPWEDCYAGKAERQYKTPLDYRRRQEYIWDCLDADTWAKAFLKVVGRKRNSVENIRFSEAGDFRHEGDILKVDRIAQLVGEEDIDVYTYSASHKLDWSGSEHFTVNQSNDYADYGNRRFTAMPEDVELPEGMVWCPFSLQTVNGKKEDRKKCGDCRICIEPEGPDVAVHLH